MNTSRRVSKRKTGGGSFTAEKRIRLAQPVDSFFTQCLGRAGVTLSNGSVQHTISTDVIQFRRTLHEILVNHQFNLKSTVEWFINEFEKYIENYARFHKLLLETLDESGGARRSFTQPSVIKLLLSIHELQEGVAGKVIEKLLDFTSPVNTPDLAPRDVRQIPKLILNQFRWLDFLVNGMELCDKLLEYVTLLPLDIQKDIIQSLPEILEDDQHPHAASKLKGICESRPELLTSCIDTWSELYMDTDLEIDILELVMNQVNSADIEYLPVVLNYIMRQKFDGRNRCSVVDVLQEIRGNLDTVSCFTPIPTVTSTPHDINVVSQSVSSSAGFVILDCIQNSLMRLKVIVNGWLKVIESIESENDHKLLDLFVLFVIHDLPSHSKSVRNLFVTKVKNKKFTETILEQFFQHKIPNLRNLFPSILSIAKHLLSQASPTIYKFAHQLYKHAFAASDVFNRQDIIVTLVGLTTSGSVNESNCSLDIIEDLTLTHPKEVERFGVLIRSILDFLEYLQLSQVRKVYKILCMLAYGVSEDSESDIQDEIESIIRKQLYHSDQRFCQKGVIAAVMAVKQIAQKRTSTGNTILGILSESNQILSESRKQQAEKILEQVYRVSEKNHNTASLFFDEMATVVASCGIHNKVLTDIRDKITDMFQEKFVSERTDLTSDLIPVVYQYDLDEGSSNDQDDDEEEESSIAVNIVSYVIESINAIEKQRNDSSCRIEPLCSHFKLLRILEQAVSEGLSEIDALLGCPVVLPDPKVLEADAFSKLEIEQKRIICASLFHCINWFRELVSAFASESEPDMKAKVLRRLAAITELQQNLNTCLMYTPGPISTVITTETSESEVKRTTSTAKKSKSRADTTLASSTQPDNNITSSIKDTATSTVLIKRTTQCDALQRLKTHFRELDLSAYIALSYERIPSSVLDSNLTHDSSDIMLESPELLFLLQELHPMVNSLFSVFTTKKKVKSKSLHLMTRDKEMAVQMSTSIIPALCSHLEAINRFLQTHADDNDGVLDKSIDSTPFSMKILSFQLICKTLTIFYNWPLLSDPFYEKELKESLQCFACRVSQSSTQEDASLTLITSKAFKYLEKFTDVMPSIVAAASLCKVIVAIQKVTQVREIKALTANYCGRLLKRSWSDLGQSTNATINVALESIIKVHIDWSNSPLDAIDDIHSNGIAELLGDEPRDQSQAYPTLAIQTIGPYYRALSVALVNSLKSISTINKDNPLCSSQELVESFMCLQQTTRLYNVLINLVKSFNVKSVLSTALKNGRLFVEAFIKNGIPIIDLLFKLKKDDVLGILKSLQQATRCLQHFCGHSKVSKDVTLTNHVPVLKKSLEALIFSVKGVVVNNGCFEAFWMGSLKNRDLQGEVIPTQLSQEVSEDDEEILDDGGSTELGSNRTSITDDEYGDDDDDDDDDEY